VIIYTVYVLTNSIERNSLATEAFASLSQSIPRLLDAPCLESKQAKMVSCGARHSAILTGTSQYSNHPREFLFQLFSGLF